MSENLERLRSALSGRYEIERELGQGGMATVYLARDVRHERNVALKVLRPELAATMGPERFLQEVRVTANLQHPHILALFDSGEADGFLYYVMPYLQGESLRERLAREHELPVAEAVKILRQVVDALSAAHRMGVVHRDIKPDNVMLSGRHAVVADFGVAKAVSEATGRHQLTTVGVALGTPAYMAPEQAAADENIDHRADIYAVGAMGYELLAGRPPFAGMAAARVLSAHVTEAPQDVTEHRKAVPAELAAVIMRCLAKKPADRWQSADELLAQLERFGTPSTGITPTQMAPVGAGPAKAGGLPGWLKVVAPVAVVGVLVAVWLGAREPAAEANEGGMAAVAASEAPRFTFAAAPFENRSGVDSLEAFGGILADYLAGQISRNDIAPVVPAAVVRELVSSRPPGTDVVSHFAAETGTAHVITGSYFAQGGSLVIQAEVVATDGSQTEALDPVEAPLTSFMDAAGAAAGVILSAAAGIVDPTQPPPSVVSQPTSFRAYGLYLEATEALMDLEQERMLDLLSEAVSEDSTFAAAYVLASVAEWQRAGLSHRVDSLIQLAARYRADLAPFDVAQLDWISGYAAGDRSGVVRASIEMERLGSRNPDLCRDARMTNQPALAIPVCLLWLEDPESAGSPAAFGYVWPDLLSNLHLSGDFEEELAQARRMRDFHPDRRPSVTRQIRPLAALGRLDEIEPLLDTLRARRNEQDWGLGGGMRIAAEYLYAYGHEELAGEANAEALAWYAAEDPGSPNHGRALLQGGDAQSALAVFEGVLVEDPGSVPDLGWAGVAALRLGDVGRAAEIEERLVAAEAEPYGLGDAHWYQAAMAAESGDLNGAVRLLQVAFDRGSTYSTSLRTWTVHRALQGHPAFENLMMPRD